LDKPMLKELREETLTPKRRRRGVVVFVDPFGITEREEFGTLLESSVVVDAWRVDYSTYDPARPSPASPPPSSPRGGAPSNHRSYDRWTTQRDPSPRHAQVRGQPVGG
jgi:hypothetical protein